MKVLYLINSLGAGGAEQSLAEMLPLLPGHGIEPAVAVLYQRSEGFEEQVLRSGVPLHVVGGDGWAQWFRHVRRLLDHLQPDVLHTTIFEADVVGRLAAVGRPPIVVGSLVNTSYGPERRQDPAVPAVKLEVARRLDSWTARHLVRRFHALTVGVQEHAVSALRIPRDRIVVVPRGRDVTRMGAPSAARRADVRRRLGLREDDEVVLNVGRQEYQKDHASLLASFAVLARERPKAVLLQAGRDGAMTPALRQQTAALGLGRRIHFLGHRPDVPDLMAASDVFVFPSRFEGMGGAVVEAMALGLPVVATDLPVLREVVETGQTGVTVPVESPALLAAAVARLLDDPDLRQAYGERARRVFLERYELQATTQRLVEALYAGLS